MRLDELRPSPVTLAAMEYRVSILTGAWVHPWLRVELRLRKILADRLEHRATDAVDRAPAQMIAERAKIEQARWFN